jgi:hypothetical protein
LSEKNGCTFFFSPGLSLDIKHDITGDS